MLLKMQACKDIQSCLEQYGPEEITVLIGDTPYFQGCECEKCPRRRMGHKADSIHIFWFYWPYDGVFDKRKPSRDRKADWEPIFAVYHPETAQCFLVTTAHWEYVCWGPWSEYKLRFLIFWHTPMIEGKLREKLFQRVVKIYRGLTKLGKFYFGVTSTLERLAFFSRQIIGRKSYQRDFTPISCLSEIPNRNPRSDPKEPSSSLETRRKEIDWEKINESVEHFCKLMQLQR